jgi:hypothetical protein
VFENDMHVRRVWSFPAGWLALTAGELLALAGLA